MNGEIMIRWRFDDEPYEATVDDLKEIIAQQEEELGGDDLVGDEREAALDVAAHFQGILLEAELQLVAATPVARLMHFNPEEGSCS